MSDKNEEKKQDTTTANPGEQENNKVDADPEAQQEGKHVENNEIDYEAEWKAEKERREAAEKALAVDRYDASKEKRTAPKEAEEPKNDDDKPLTKAEALKLIQDGTQMSAKVINEAKADIIVSSLTSNDAEKKLVLEKWRNRTFPAYLSIEEQVQEAYVLANSKRILGKSAEIQRALKSKESANSIAADNRRTPDKSKGEGEVSGDVKQILSQGNWKYNSDSKRYEKKLPNGKLMYRDPKTGRVILDGLTPQAR